MSTYLFTSESVSQGHPDKVSDQISDAIVDAYIADDPNAKVACETLVTTNQTIIAGEIRSTANIDVDTIVRETINSIGYDKPEYNFCGSNCEILNLLHSQSEDIIRGVNRGEESNQGAGDQGMMFGYATNETEAYLPLSLYMSNLILRELNLIRMQPGAMDYLRPDAKSQVTVEYNEDGTPLRIHTIVISTQHDEFIKATESLSQEKADKQMARRIREDIKSILIPRVKERVSGKIREMFDSDLVLHVNPTGKFVIGGPDGDTGLTGRKIIVDTYGGKGAHGGGAFSGKDPSKVDRSAAYAARHIAKNLVAAGVADEILVQIAYAIGVAQPVSLFIDTYGKSHIEFTDVEIAETIKRAVDLTPGGIINRLKLKNPIYQTTASYGHFGREPFVGTIEKETGYLPVEYFTWEKLDLVDKIRTLFNLQK